LFFLFEKLLVPAKAVLAVNVAHKVPFLGEGEATLLAGEEPQLLVDADVGTYVSQLFELAPARQAFQKSFLGTSSLINTPKNFYCH